MIVSPHSHHLSITDLLLRDPQHPEVQAQLEALYRALCQEERAITAQRVLLARILKKTRDSLDNPPPNRV